MTFRQGVLCVLTAATMVVVLLQLTARAGGPLPEPPASCLPPPVAYMA